jgi:hypothetical protein
VFLLLTIERGGQKAQGTRQDATNGGFNVKTTVDEAPLESLLQNRQSSYAPF